MAVVNIPNIESFETYNHLEGTTAQKTKEIVDGIHESLNGLDCVLKSMSSTYYHDLLKPVLTLKIGDTTTVSVVGQSGAGKSSLINAIVDIDGLMPTAIFQACTSFATTLKYSEDESYGLKAEFFSREEFKRQLEEYLECYTDTDGNDLVPIGMTDEKDEGVIARAAIKNLFPRLTVNAEERKKLLLLDERLDELGNELDRNPYEKVFLRTEKDNCKSFVELYHGLALQINKSQEGESRPLWMFVKNVTLSVPCNVLATGLQLVDLPGSNDEQISRSAVAVRESVHHQGQLLVLEQNRCITDGAQRPIIEKALRRIGADTDRYTSFHIIVTKCDGTMDRREFYSDIAGLEAKMGPLEQELQGHQHRLDISNNNVSKERENLKRLRTHGKSLRNKASLWETHLQRVTQGHELTLTADELDQLLSERATVPRTYSYEELQRAYDEAKKTAFEAATTYYDMETAVEGKDESRQEIKSELDDVTRRLSKLVLGETGGWIAGILQKKVEDLVKDMAIPGLDISNENQSRISVIMTAAKQYFLGKQGSATKLFPDEAATGIPETRNLCLRIHDDDIRAAGKKILYNVDLKLNALRPMVTGESDYNNIPPQQQQNRRAAFETAGSVLDEELIKISNQLTAGIDTLCTRAKEDNKEGVTKCHQQIRAFGQGLSKINANLLKACLRHHGKWQGRAIKIKAWNEVLSDPLGAHLALHLNNVLLPNLRTLLARINDKVIGIIDAYHDAMVAEIDQAMRSSIEVMRDTCKEQAETTLQRWIEMTSPALEQALLAVTKLELGESVTIQLRRPFDQIMSNQHVFTGHGMVEKTVKAVCNAISAASPAIFNAGLEQTVNRLQQHDLGDYIKEYAKQVKGIFNNLTQIYKVRLVTTITNRDRQQNDHLALMLASTRELIYSKLQS